MLLEFAEDLVQVLVREEAVRLHPPLPRLLVQDSSYKTTRVVD